MLLQPLLDQLSALGLNGCRAALEAQQQNSQYAELTFEDRLGLLLEVECTRRADKRLQRRVKNARFALARHHRRSEVFTHARPRTAPGAGPGAGRMDSTPFECVCPRPHRGREDFSRLRAWPGRLSTGLQRALRTHLPLAASIASGPGRWLLCQTAWPAWHACHCSFSTTGCAIR